MLGVKYPKEANINHKVINAFDVPTYKMTPHFDEAYKFIKDALSTGNILVHCAAGISRVKFGDYLVNNLCFSVPDARERIWIQACNADGKE